MDGERRDLYVVVDPTFGERLASLPAGVPVWIVDTPTNSPVARRLWKERPNANQFTGITTYRVPADTSPEENLINELDTIDLHQGIHSAEPPYMQLEVIGTSLSERIKSELAEYGFVEFHLTPNGFRTVRQELP
jgi:hypothetical protein